MGSAASGRTGGRAAPNRSRGLHLLLTITTGCAVVALTTHLLLHGSGSDAWWVDAVGLVAIALLPVQYWLLWTPVSLQSRWQARADAAEHSVSLALRTGGQCLWRTDTHGTIVEASGQGEQVFGYRPDQLVGRCAFDLLHADDAERVTSIVRSPVTAVDGWNELWMHCVAPGGDDRWVVSSAFPVLDQHGVLTGFEGSTWMARGEREVQLRHQATWRRIRAMVERPDLDIALQPIWDLTSREALGAEALARFRSVPTLPPDRWFADARAVGLGPELELLCVERAIAAARALPAPHYLSVNVSPAVVADPRLLDLVRGADHLVGRLVLEITEHESIEDYAQLVEPLRLLRTAGARVAVDDAGSGFASFSHIVRLRPEIIKLDRTLVAGIDDDAARRALAAAVVMFAFEIDAAVVAEGVETQPEYDTLCSLGLDAAQGYLLGRPTVDDLEWRSWRTAEPASAAVPQTG